MDLTLARHHLDAGAVEARPIGHEAFLLADGEQLAGAVWSAVDQCPAPITLEASLADRARVQALAGHRLHGVAPDLDHGCHRPKAYRPTYDHVVPSDAKDLPYYEPLSARDAWFGRRGIRIPLRNPLLLASTGRRIRQSHGRAKPGRPGRVRDRTIDSNG